MQAQMSGGSVSAETVSADFGTRLVAWLIDAVIVGVPAFILMMLLPVMLIYPLLLVASVGYQLYFWTTIPITPKVISQWFRFARAVRFQKPSLQARGRE